MGQRWSQKIRVGCSIIVLRLFGIVLPCGSCVLLLFLSLAQVAKLGFVSWSQAFQCKDCWTCLVFYSMLLFPLGLWGNLYILVCFLCGVSCCRSLLCFPWKFSCFIFNITLAVLSMVDLKLSSGTGPLILRKRCQSILAQPWVVMIDCLFKASEDQESNKNFL